MWKKRREPYSSWGSCTMLGAVLLLGILGQVVFLYKSLEKP